MKVILGAAALLLLATGCQGSPAPAADDAPAARPVAASSPEASEAPEPREHRGWWVTSRIRADLDGDGLPDVVRVREPDSMRGVELVVELANGDTTVRRMRHMSSLDLQTWDAADVDGTPGEEVFVMKEVPRRVFRTLTWRDGRFEEIPLPGGRLLTDDFSPGIRLRAWWIDGATLVSYVSTGRCEGGYDYVDCPVTMEVRATRWRVVDGVWHTRPMGTHCVREDDQHVLLAC